MGRIKGFLDYQRKMPGKEKVEDRLKHWHEVTKSLTEEELKQQSARWMDCGTPFCHWACPIANIIPDFNYLVYKDQ